MDFSVWPTSWRSWTEIHALATMADDDGWHGFWFADHLLQGGRYDGGGTACHDAWAILPAVATVTERVRLGSLVSPFSFRHPGLLYTAAVSLDDVSGGRAVLGVGAGWHEEEHDAYGFALGGPRQRSDRLEEGCRSLRALVDDGTTTVDGDHFRVRAVAKRPRPAARIPILVGGKGERRTLPIAARYADEWNAWVELEDVAGKLAVLRAACDDVGRDPAELRVSVNAYVAVDRDPVVVQELGALAGSRPVLAGSPEQVVDRLGTLADLGVDEVVVVDWNLDDPRRRIDTLRAFRSEVVGPLVSRP